MTGTVGDFREVLERLANELRDVRSNIEFSNMDGDVAYYSALNSVASCIENVLRDTSKGHAEDDPVRKVKAVHSVV